MRDRLAPRRCSRDAQGSCTMAASIAPDFERSDQATLAEALDGDAGARRCPRAASSDEQRQRAGRAGRADPDGLAGEIGEGLDRVLLRRGHEQRDRRRRGEAEDEPRRRAARVRRAESAASSDVAAERDAARGRVPRAASGLRANGLAGRRRELLLGEVALGRGHAHGQVFRGSVAGPATRDRQAPPGARSGPRSRALAFPPERRGLGRPRASAMSRAMRSAASGTARAAGALAHGRRAPARSAQKPRRRLREGRPASASTCGSTTAPPAASTMRALTVCSSPLVPGSGT